MKLSDIRTIELDVTDIDKHFLRTLSAYDVKMKLKMWIGPAGGNPLVELTGTVGALRRVVVDLSEGGADVDHIMNQG